MDFNVAKIVGTASQNSWSQVHVFKPNVEEPEGKEKLDNFGQLLAALEFKAVGEGVEVTSFGTEIIQRLQEIYFANESEGILKKLNQTMETLAAEFLPQIELSLIMAVEWRNFIYVGRSGGGQVYLKRGETLVPLFADETEAAQVVSGKLEPGDKLLLGTKRFFKIVPEETTAAAMKQGTVDDTMETLATLLHDHEANSRAAGIVFEAIGEVDSIVATPASALPPKIPTRGPFSGAPLAAAAATIGAVFQGVTRPISDLLSRRQIHLGGIDSKKRKTAATIALILLLVFGASLVLAGRKRSQSRQQAEIQSITEEVSYRLNEAKGLISLNPLRAKSLLTESKTRLDEYRKAHDNKLPESLTALEQEVLVLLGSAQRDYQANGVEWFAFSITEDGFIGSDWEADENQVVAWDGAKQSLLSLNLETKSSDVLIAGEAVAGGQLVGLAGDRSFVVNNNKIVIVDDGGEVVGEVGADEWGNIADAVGFGGNLYLLDAVANGQIWKYTGVDAGLGSKQPYLKGEDLDLSSAVSMAIDGSVWVLFSDGTIVKYVRGVKDVFVVTGLDEALVEPIKIYTSPEVDNLYILDRQSTRVVVIGKNGEYQSQFRWPGVAGAKDLVVSEELKKILLLTGEKVFSLDLQ